jgi:hypothetical protein
MMATTICLAANGTLQSPKAGGFFWIYLNWALGLRELGCRVLWLERIPPTFPSCDIARRVRQLKTRLRKFGLEDGLVLSLEAHANRPSDALAGCLDFEVAREADLLLNFCSDLPRVQHFRRSAFVDIDPGLTQIWVVSSQIALQRHDIYFTIGETVGKPDALFPDADLEWHYTPPPVSLPRWSVTQAPNGAPFTTVTNWWREWVQYDGESYDNTKRAGFLPFLDLPRRTQIPLELAIVMGAKPDRALLKAEGWRVEDAWRVTGNPQSYQAYIQRSRGEFSCAKPSYVRLQTAWISDRTLCYLAAGKPAIVQHTGPSRVLPERSGIFRFTDIDHAVRCLEDAAADYDRQCRLARALAEEHFDAKRVVARVLERALA